MKEVLQLLFLTINGETVKMEVSARNGLLCGVHRLDGSGTGYGNTSLSAAMESMYEKYPGIRFTGIRIVVTTEIMLPKPKEDT